MAKGTIILFFILAIIATLLLGINMGKKIGNFQLVTPSPTIFLPSPTLSLTTPTPATSTATISAQPTKKIMSLTTYTNNTCGFSFSYPGSFIRQKTINEQSIIYTDPENPSVAIAATCAQALPRPPVASEKIESILVAGRPATLYHDQNPDGSPRDEVIVKHPNNDMEIILAGYGTTFYTALSTFKFPE